MPLPLIALAAAQGGLSALGKLMGGSAEKRAANARAAALEAAAVQDRLEAGVDAQLAIDEGERTSARAATLAAANGGGFGGSTAGVLDDLSRQAVFNARSAAYRGVTAARNRVYEAGVARVEGANAQRQSLIEAGSSLLSGAAQAYQFSQPSAAKRRA